MDLNEIEAKADQLLDRLFAEKETGGYWAGAAEVRDICFKLDGLSRAATVKEAVAAQYPNLVLRVTEPTKPAVDRLHELVSYAENEGRSPNEDFAAGYRDMATKLQEILQEGGL